MKEGIQKFGRKLSAMVMPNIGAFIAWGLITAIFIPGGWWPNEHIAALVGPMLKYLLPTLIAYTAGKNVGGTRGGVAGAVAAMGVIIGTDTPMFLGAMIMGPIAGYAVKAFDKKIQGKVAPGFEMLVDNFSLGIIAMLLCLAGYLVIGHAVSWLTGIISSGVNFLLKHSLNPLLSLIVDPAKVLFLNNAVNHGIMTPLGIEQAAEAGHSMLFLIDPNPGPGLGILLACWVFGKGSTKASAPGAAIIQLFGGIHEIYFPYVLARPILLLAVIAGNVCSLLFFTLTDFGLVAPASPGSIISIILMSPRGKTIIGILGVLIATAVSFLLAWPMVRRNPDFQGGDEPAAPATPSATSLSGGLAAVRKIVFACDAGMGSSALGATRFKARLMKINRADVVCTNSAVNSIPSDASVVVTQTALADRARTEAPGIEVIAITNFLADPLLDALLARVQAGPDAAAAAAVVTAAQPVVTEPEAPAAMLLESGIAVGLEPETKEQAIRRAGNMLVAGGYVTESYVDAMLEREKITTTYMGMGLAVPHGTAEAKKGVLHSGIVVLQYPQGVDFDGELAHLLVGIAGVGDDHLAILSKVAGALDDPDVLNTIFNTSDKQEILKTLSI